MYRSYMFGTREYQPAAINLVAVPRWLDLALKAKNVTVEQALGANPDMGFCSFSDVGFSRAILSQQEVDFHNDVSWKLADWLFPEQKKREKREQLYAELVNDWHAVPLVKGLHLHLHPIILGSNLIGLYHVEEQPGVTDTDLYGRILRCAHTLAYSKIGVESFGCDLIKDVMYEISLGQ